MPENAQSEEQGGILPIAGKGLRIEREGRVLLDVSEVSLGKPGVTTIIGHNGAGKSLLLKVLTGLVKPDVGSVTWGGRLPARSGYRRLGYMKQNAVLLRRSAKANLEYALKLAGRSRREADREAAGILERFDLSAIADTSARLLSGGEKQRLSLARMLAADPEIILLDEPTASLDPLSTKAIEGKIRELRDDGKSIVLVTHDLFQARSLSDDIIFLDQARILASQSAKSFFDNPPCDEAAKFLGV